MDSIKHKMDTMIREKDAALAKAIAFEAEAKEFDATGCNFEREVNEIQIRIAKIEDQLDITMSNTKDTSDKLEIADKEAIDAELQIGALRRRFALLEEEAARNNSKLQDNIAKTAAEEASSAKNEEGRRAAEARSFAAEQKLEASEAELEEAQAVATAANHKYEDVSRKLKVVQGDLDRVIERAEEFEAKSRLIETEVREQEVKVKETEAITIKNSEEEDKLENKISRLREEFKLADTRAEFAERSVDKLESTIDGLLESLMNEKLNYRNISEKLDKTLNDMMHMA